MSASLQHIRSRGPFPLPLPFTAALMRRVSVFGVVLGMVLAFLVPSILYFAATDVMFSVLAGWSVLALVGGFFFAIFCAGLILALVFGFRIGAAVFWFTISVFGGFGAAVLGRHPTGELGVRHFLRDIREPALGLLISVLLMLPIFVGVSVLSAATE